MNLGFATKALPYVKKIVPIAFGAITGAVGAVSSQKAAQEMTDLKNRLAAVEAMVKKD